MNDGGPRSDGADDAEAPGSSHGRARGQIVLTTRTQLVDERVSQIKQLMVSGQWSRARRLSLGRQWGIPDSTVKTYSAAAGRQLRQAQDDDELAEARETRVGRLERLSAAAEEDDDLRTAVRAEAEAAKIQGLVTSDVRMVVVVPIAGKDIKATVDELRALVGRISVFLGEKHPDVAAELAAHLEESTL